VDLVDGELVIHGAAASPSSSVAVISPSVTARAPDMPTTLIVSSPSASTSLVGVSVNVSVPLAAPAPMLIVSAPTVS